MCVVSSLEAPSGVRWLLVSGAMVGGVAEVLLAAVLAVVAISASSRAAVLPSLPFSSWPSLALKMFSAGARRSEAVCVIWPSVVVSWTAPLLVLG